MFNVLLRYFKKYKMKIDRKILIRVIIVAVIILIFSAVVIYLIEPEGQFNKFTDALWWAIVTATTVGYGDFYPVSTVGRIIAIFLMITGIGLLGAITATITDLFIKIEKRRELGQLKADYQGHIIVCGWCSKAKEVIDQLLNENMENKQLVLVADIERDPFPDNDLVHFVHGNIDSKDALEKASVRQAKTAIILNEDDNDATTVLSALTINSLNPEIYSVAEISKEENRIHLDHARVNEIIVNGSINSRMMVRAALYHGTSIILNELLTNTVGNEIYISLVTKNQVRQLYKDLITYFKCEKDATLLGIKRGTEILLNPPHAEIVQDGDQLIYMAQDKIKEFI